jgi:outer membrane lipoprotein-sorting protein
MIRLSPRAVRIVLLALLLLCCRQGGAAGAAPSENQIQGEERVRILERIRERQRNVTAVRATVVQRKRHPMLKAEAVSEGTLLFQFPDRMRWEIRRPEHTIIAIDRNTLLTYRPDMKEAERRDLRDEFGTRAAMEFFISGMSLDLAELEKRFQAELYRENGRLLLLLTPRSRWVAQVVASVAIYQREEDALPEQIVVTGQKGDRTETTLTGVTLNPQIPEDAFALRLGPEVRVTDVRKPTGDRGSDR